MHTNRRIFRTVMMLLILCMISSIMISGSLAKYSSEFSGQDTALIATWDITAGTANVSLWDISGLDQVTFMDSSGNVAELSLFDHPFDTHVNQVIGDDFIVAPGVMGVFSLHVFSASDVSAIIELEIEPLDNNPELTVDNVTHELPIRFLVGEPGDYFDENNPYNPDNPDWSVLINNSSDVYGLAKAIPKAIFEGRGFAKCELVPGDDPDDTNRFLLTPGTKIGSMHANINIYWGWPYDQLGEEQNKIDTLFGTMSAQQNERLSYGIRIKLKATQVEPEIDPNPGL